MRPSPSPAILLACGFVFGSVSPIFAGTAKEAIHALHRSKGENAVRNIISMRGFHGQDQPGTWEIVTSEPSLREFRAYQVSSGQLTGESRVDRAPSRIVLNPGKLRLDSSDAFRVANEQARRKLIGFDAIDYELRAVDYSYSPVWRITLRSSTGSVVGRMEISAETGNVRWPAVNNASAPATDSRQNNQQRHYLVSNDGVDYARYEDRDYWSDRDMNRSRQRNYLWWQKSTDGLQYAGHNIKQGFRETGAAFRDIFEGDAVFRSTGKKRTHVRKAAHTRPLVSKR